MYWRRWRLVEIGDVSVVLIIGTVECQGPTIQTHDPERYTEEGGAEPLASASSRESDREHIAHHRVCGDNRPLSRPSMKQIIKTPAKQPVPTLASGSYHSRPR
jgi:hypothetical protein